MRSTTVVRAPRIQPIRRFPGNSRMASVRVHGSKEDGKPTEDVGLKAAWYGAEVLGNVIGATKGSSDAKRTDSGASAGPTTRGDLIASIRADYEQNYFVSGTGDMTGYAPDCTFADPFVSFNGIDRFKKNVSNLGGLMREIKLDVVEFKEEGNEVRTKWRFSCVLTWPPWRPRLAAAGGTTHVIDPATNRVVKHIEMWDIEPKKVLSQLTLPAAKVPVTRWEMFALSLNRGDARGIWLFFSPLALQLAGVGIGLCMLERLFTLGSMSPPWLLEMGLWHLAGFCAVTEVAKFSGGMQGGDTGAGGRF